MKILNKLLNLKKIFEKPFETLNTIYISESAILNNFDLYKKNNPNINIFPVLKSNAYGHGIKQIATILNKRRIDYIVVDSYYEALQVRECNKSKILIIGYTLPSNFKYMDFSFVTIVVYDLDTIRQLGKLRKNVKIHLKIDTGMNRQGVLVHDLTNIILEIKKYKNLILEGVCSHLSDADNLIDDYSKKQIDIFRQSIKIIEDNGFKLKYKHIGNTAGGLKGFGSNFCNSIRLGIGLYGINPISKNDLFYDKLNNLKLALIFQTTLIIKKHVNKGEKISYNGICELSSDSEIGVIPVGYYEGLNRKLSNNFSIKYNNSYLNILGRICMNLTVINLNGVNIDVGNKIIVLSNNIEDYNNIYNVAEKCETIPYEILVKLSESIRRIIVD